MKRKTRKSVNVTTISLPPEEATRFKEAVSYYGFEGMSAFFRKAGRTLVDHYKRGDALITPLTFIAK